MNHILSHLVVDVAVGEHCVEVLHAFSRTPIIVVLQPPLDGTHVHRLFDDFVIILETQRGKQSQGIRDTEARKARRPPPRGRAMQVAAARDVQLTA